jgi:hypothetical protein
MSFINYLVFKVTAILDYFINLFLSSLYAGSTELILLHSAFIFSLKTHDIDTDVALVSFSSAMLAFTALFYKFNVHKGDSILVLGAGTVLLLALFFILFF